jgi:GTP-binding protein
MDQSFVVADIPGLIDGAHLGHGLGTQFLKHIERTRVIVHLVDVSGMSGDPVDDFKAIARELKLYNPELAEKPKIVVATKMDAADPEKARKLEQWCGQNGMDVIKISSVTGEGLDELKRSVFSILSSQSAGRS